MDACHAEGLAIFLDVVYNHFGPEGNYLGEFGPYFTDRYKTPWGAAVNYDGAGCDAVRDFVLDNVRMWLEEFHFDGLRLDAVHADLRPGRAAHPPGDQGGRPRTSAARRGWPAIVIAESDLNDPRLLYPARPRRLRPGCPVDRRLPPRRARLPHRRARTGTTSTSARPGNWPGPSRRPFVYAWDYSPFRDRKHGAPPEGLSGDRFVVCLQNHDQVGNRAGGDRLDALLGSPAKQRLAAGLLLLSPYLPLLFMGEEYGEENPFPFFCSFGDPELVEAVREGRKKEFDAFTWQGEVPDPQGEETFASARLSWSWPEGTHRAGLRRLYRDLLTARREWPALRDFEHRSARLLGRRAERRPAPGAGPRRRAPGEVGPGAASTSATGRPGCPAASPAGRSVLFSSEAAAYGGGRREAGPVDELAPFEFIVFGPPSWRAFPDR